MFARLGQLPDVTAITKQLGGIQTQVDTMKVQAEKAVQWHFIAQGTQILLLLLILVNVSKSK